jgi:hypothetical protein
MGVVEYVRDDIFAEPSGERLNWLAVGFGAVTIGITVIGLTDLYLEFVFMGLGFVCLGSAELISTGHRQIAGVLRLCSIVAFVLLGLSHVVPILL